MNILKERQKIRIQRAIGNAMEALRRMEGVSSSERSTTEDIYKIASNLLEISPRTHDLHTRMLFFAGLQVQERHSYRQVRTFLKQNPEIDHVSKLGSKRLEEIELILRRGGLDCPLAIRLFHAAYQKEMNNSEARSYLPTDGGPE